jgi:hypothetical protein
LEVNRLRRKFRRGTIAVGAFAIIAIFLIAISCMTVLIMEYSRFSYSAKSANEVVAAKAKESLQVQVSTVGTTGPWLTGWQYRKSHVINPAGGAGTNYQIRIRVNFGSGIDGGENVYLNGKCRTDFGDIRFADDDGVTELAYWMESKVDSSYAVFWVKVADDLSTGSVTIYCYYGNPSATTTSNENNVFDYVDRGDQTTSWTLAGSSGQDASVGDPAPSYYAVSTGGSYMNRNIGLVSNRLIVFNMKTNGLGNLFFLVNSAGAGQMFRLETRPGSYSGFATTSSWTSWNAPSSGFTATTNTWYKLAIAITSATSTTLYYQQTTDSSPSLPATTLGTFTISNNGGFIGLVGDGLGSSYRTWWDNIIVRKYVSPEPIQQAWRNEETAQAGQTTITVTNMGSTSSLVIGVFAVNPADNNPTYYPISPVSVGVLNKKSFPIQHPITDNWHVGVLTSLGNIFWESEAITPPTGPWLTGWQYRKSHVINPAGGAGTNYQKQITVHYDSGTDGDDDVYLNSHSRTDFGDVRFTDDDGTTLLDYWLDPASLVSGVSAEFWVEVADDLSTTAQTIYVYFGNPTATTTSNGDNTFLFFDDFLGTTLDTAKWDVYGTGSYSVANSELVLTHGSYTWERVQSKTTFGVGYAFRARYRTSDPSDYNKPDYLEWGDTSTGENPANIIGYYKNDYHNRFWRTSSQSIDKGAMISTAYKLIEVGRDGSASARCFYENTYENQLTTGVTGTNKKVSIKVGAAGWGGYAHTGYTDWLLVRKFVYPEPSHGAWGNEETAP